MLTQKLLAVTNLGADWVLWLLVLLSIVSVGVMLERAAFFLARRVADADALSARLLAGDLAGARQAVDGRQDRKSTRLNSSHVEISYAVFCLKKKRKTKTREFVKRIIKHR